MRKTIRSRKLNRRDFMKLGGGVLAGAALTRLLPRTLGQSGLIAMADGYSQVAPAPADLSLVGALAADVLARAIVRGVRAAETSHGIPGVTT